jgi:hypothetical protein
MQWILPLLWCRVFCLSYATADDTPITLTAADIRVHLPRSSALVLGTWSLANYSSSDIYSFDLSVPTVSPSAEAPTAFHARYGDSISILVAAVPEFLGTIDLLGRLLDLQQLRRSRRGSAPTMTTGATQRLVGSVPAEEISIELRDSTTSDSLVTLITSAPRGSDVALIIVRSRTNPRTVGTTCHRIYSQILASITMENVHHRDTSHLRHPHGWSVAIPHAWSTKVSTSRSSSFFLLNGSEDTLWNTVTVQLPMVRLDYLVAHNPYSDSTLVDVIEHVAARKGLERWSPTGHPRVGTHEGIWYRSLSPRRGDTVQTTYGIFGTRDWIAVIQLIAWERDMAHIERILPELVGVLHIPAQK